MDTVHAVSTTDATFGDLFEGDETAIEAALTSLGDDDLLLAVLVINTQPIYPGTDERNTAYLLANIFAHAKTAGGAAQIAYALFEHVQPRLVVAGLCHSTGLEQPKLGGLNEAGTLDVTKLFAEHINALPFGQALINSALAAELRRVRSIRHAEPSTALVVGLLPYADDIDTVTQAAQFIGGGIPATALERLIELGATAVIDDLVGDGASLGIRYRHDAPCRLAVANASNAVQLRLAKQTNLGYVYRQEATKHLSSAELLEIATGSPHQNVRDSANRELALRKELMINVPEFSRL
jgi:hypothetical protein